MSRKSTSSPSGPATVGLLPSAAALLAPSSAGLSAAAVPSALGRLSSSAARLPPSGGPLPASLALAFWRLPSASLPAWSGRTPVRTPPRTPQATARPVPPPTPEPTSFAHGPLLRLLISVVAAKTTPIHPSGRRGVLRSSQARSSRKSLALLAHPPGLLLCRRFPTHPEPLNYRSHTPNEHEDRQYER